MGLILRANQGLISFFRFEDTTIVIENNFNVGNVTFAATHIGFSLSSDI